MSVLHGLVAEFDALKARFHDLIEPHKTLGDKAEEIWRAVVDSVHDLEARLADIEMRLIDTRIASAQPEVAQNTGSGVAPEAPKAAPASDGAAQLKAAAGAAPQQ